MDSGLGGVSVLRALRENLPHESFIYWADNANAPYGGKSREHIRQLAMTVAQRLIDADVKVLVVACNTATSAAIDQMRQQFTIPVISMEPAIKPALTQGKDAILMLATEATCHLERYRRLKQRLDGEHRIIDIPCSGWVECIEAHVGEKDACLTMVRHTLQPYSQSKVNSIVLGCTHYPLIEHQIRSIAEEFWGAECQMFDGRKGTVSQLVRVLKQRGQQAESIAPPTCILHATNETEEYTSLMNQVLTSGKDGVIDPMRVEPLGQEGSWT
jgi:glutamate racemase